MIDLTGNTIKTKPKAKTTNNISRPILVEGSTANYPPHKIKLNPLLWLTDENTIRNKRLYA